MPDGELHTLKDTDYAVAPGVTLAELLEERNWTTQDVADKTGIQVSQVDAIKYGLQPLTYNIVCHLSLLFGLPESFWLEMERQFHADLVRLGLTRERWRDDWYGKTDLC